jgi:hypothetical protein
MRKFSESTAGIHSGPLTYNENHLFQLRSLLFSQFASHFLPKALLRWHLSRWSLEAWHFHGCPYRNRVVEQVVTAPAE